MKNSNEKSKEFICCDKCKGQRYNGAWYDCCIRDLDCKCHKPSVEVKNCDYIEGVGGGQNCNKCRPAVINENIIRYNLEITVPKNTKNIKITGNNGHKCIGTGACGYCNPKIEGSTGSSGVTESEENKCKYGHSFINESLSCSKCKNSCEPQSIPLDRNEGEETICGQKDCKTCKWANDYIKSEPTPNLTPESTEVEEWEKTLSTFCNEQNLSNCVSVGLNLFIKGVLYTHSKKLKKKISRDVMYKLAKEVVKPQLLKNVINIINNTKI